MVARQLIQYCRLELDRKSNLHHASPFPKVIFLFPFLKIMWNFYSCMFQYTTCNNIQKKKKKNLNIPYKKTYIHIQQNFIFWRKILTSTYHVFLNSPLFCHKSNYFIESKSYQVLYSKFQMLNKCDNFWQK